MNCAYCRHPLRSCACLQPTPAKRAAEIQSDNEWAQARADGYVAFVHPEVDWLAELGKPVKAAGTPLYQGELGFLNGDTHHALMFDLRAGQTVAATGDFHTHYGTIYRLTQAGYGNVVGDIGVIREALQDRNGARATLTAGPPGSMGEEINADDWLERFLRSEPGSVVVRIDMGSADGDMSTEPRMCGLSALGEAVRAWCMEQVRDEDDRAALEAINMRPRELASIRRTPFGAEPWDMAAGEAS
jgi:hypothetical protein